MKKSIKRTITAAAIAAVAIFGGGCGDDGVGTQTDPRAEKFLLRFVDSHPLVLKPGEAWVGTDNDGNLDGFMFHADGTYTYIVKPAGANEWTVSAVNGHGDTVGAWSEGGIEFWGRTYGYRIDGDILTLLHETYGNEILFKNVGINVANL